MTSKPKINAHLIWFDKTNSSLKLVLSYYNAESSLFKPFGGNKTYLLAIQTTSEDEKLGVMNSNPGIAMMFKLNQLKFNLELELIRA